MDTNSASHRNLTWIMLRLKSWRFGILREKMGCERHRSHWIWFGYGSISLPRFHLVAIVLLRFIRRCRWFDDQSSHAHLMNKRETKCGKHLFALSMPVVNLVRRCGMLANRNFRWRQRTRAIRVHRVLSCTSVADPQYWALSRML